jgi:GT2 family glycosyltransferase/SAM-dependent methyltransferase
VSREDILRSLFDTSGFGLEIGGSYNPLLPRSNGYNVETLDHASREDLIAKYAAPNESTDRIEPVTYVSDGRSMLEIIGASSRYDFIVASHVIEHTTDFIGFLKDSEALLKPDGVLVLAVPDLRFCFDFFRSPSSLGQVIEAHRQRRTRHSLAELFDSISLECRRGEELAWQRPQLGPFKLMRDLPTAWETAQSLFEKTEYTDAHGWTFTPSSFRYLLKALAKLGFIGLVEAHFAFTNGFEFYVVLSRTGSGCHLDDAELLKSIKEELREVPAEQISDASGYRQSIGDYVPISRSQMRPVAARPSVRSIAAIIPLYTGFPFIDDCLQSVLAQTRPPDEIIVVDDGSSDYGPQRVKEIAKDHPSIKLLFKTNGGQSSARNFGAAHTTCDLIAFLDQDDFWHPDHLEELIKPFRDLAHYNIGWSYSDLDRVDLQGNIVMRRYLRALEATHPKTSIFQCLRENMYVLPSASLILRQAFEAVGGFDERLIGYEDDDLFLRMFRAGHENVFIDRSLSSWRIHAGSASYSEKMLRSRMVYAEKLLQEFPDDPRLHLYFSREFIGPRFLRSAFFSYALGVRLNEPKLCREAARQMAFFAERSRWRDRIPARLITPVLEIPLLGRFLVRVLVAWHSTKYSFKDRLYRHAERTP